MTCRGLMWVSLTDHTVLCADDGHVQDVGWHTSGTQHMSVFFLSFPSEQISWLFVATVS